MDHLSLLDPIKIDHLINQRARESKFGEHIKIISNLRNIYEQLIDLDVTYVLFGVAEDIGVKANHGKGGTDKTWDATLKVLLNIQDNSFINASDVLILGKLEFPDYMDRLDTYNDNPVKYVKKARKLVSKIDKEVAFLVYNIIKAGKIPIVVGGGHNNSYGLLKGASMASLKPINCINLDAHSDFRPEEGRHSGNGFSYAFAEGFLDRYFIYGLHENYTSNNILKNLSKLKAIDFLTFEAIEIAQTEDWKTNLEYALKHIENSAFGIEIDCDAIRDIPSSAMSPTGFSVEQARQFINYFGNHPNAQYLHICEAAPTDADTDTTGKLISYLITDFIKANASKNNRL